MDQNADSPCIDVCKTDDDSGLCRGCRRTLNEIAQWQTYSTTERRAILDDLANRKLWARRLPYDPPTAGS